MNKPLSTALAAALAVVLFVPLRSDAVAISPAGARAMSATANIFGAVAANHAQTSALINFVQTGNMSSLAAFPKPQAPLEMPRLIQNMTPHRIEPTIAPLPSAEAQIEATKFIAGLQAALETGEQPSAETIEQLNRLAAAAHELNLGDEGERAVLEVATSELNPAVNSARQRTQLMAKLGEHLAAALNAEHPAEAPLDGNLDHAAVSHPAPAAKHSGAAHLVPNMHGDHLYAIPENGPLTYRYTGNTAPFADLVFEMAVMADLTNREVIADTAKNKRIVVSAGPAALAALEANRDVRPKDLIGSKKVAWARMDKSLRSGTLANAADDHALLLPLPAGDAARQAVEAYALAHHAGRKAVVDVNGKQFLIHPEQHQDRQAIAALTEAIAANATLPHLSGSAIDTLSPAAVPAASPAASADAEKPAAGKPLRWVQFLGLGISLVLLAYFVFPSVLPAFLMTALNYGFPMFWGYDFKPALVALMLAPMLLNFWNAWQAKASKAPKAALVAAETAKAEAPAAPVVADAREIPQVPAANPAEDAAAPVKAADEVVAPVKTADEAVPAPVVAAEPVVVDAAALEAEAHAHAKAGRWAEAAVAFRRAADAESNPSRVALASAWERVAQIHVGNGGNMSRAARLQWIAALTKTLGAPKNWHWRLQVAAMRDFVEQARSLRQQAADAGSAASVPAADKFEDDAARFRDILIASPAYGQNKFGRGGTTSLVSDDEGVRDAIMELDAALSVRAKLNEAATEANRAAVAKFAREEQVLHSENAGDTRFWIGYLAAHQAYISDLTRAGQIDEAKKVFEIAMDRAQQTMFVKHDRKGTADIEAAMVAFVRAALFPAGTAATLETVEAFSGKLSRAQPLVQVWLMEALSAEARQRGESTDSFKSAALGAYANMLTHLHYWTSSSGDRFYDQYATRIALVKEQAAAFENPDAAYAAAAARNELPREMAGTAFAKSADSLIDTVDFMDARNPGTTELWVAYLKAMAGRIGELHRNGAAGSIEEADRLIRDAKNALALVASHWSEDAAVMAALKEYEEALRARPQPVQKLRKMPIRSAEKTSPAPAVVDAAPGLVVESKSDGAAEVAALIARAADPAVEAGPRWVAAQQALSRAEKSENAAMLDAGFWTTYFDAATNALERGLSAESRRRVNREIGPAFAKIKGREDLAGIQPAVDRFKAASKLVKQMTAPGAK